VSYKSSKYVLRMSLRGGFLVFRLKTMKKPIKHLSI